MNNFFDRIDLSKKFPGYFNKKILQAGILIALISTVLAFTLNGFELNAPYIECPSHMTQCNNIYVCPEDDISSLNSRSRTGVDCVELPQSACRDFFPICEQTKLKGGEILGKKPNFFLRNNGIISILAILIAFIVNHIYYKKNGKK